MSLLSPKHKDTRNASRSAAAPNDGLARPLRSSRHSSICMRVVGLHALLLIRISSCHNGLSGFRVTQVDGLMWYVRWNKIEITGFMNRRFAQSRPVTRFDTTLQQINRGFVAAMKVRFG
jgi:hypothetical protein